MKTETFIKDDDFLIKVNEMVRLINFEKETRTFRNRYPVNSDLYAQIDKIVQRLIGRIHSLAN